MITIEVYEDEDGRQPFIKWLAGIDRHARRRVNIALARLEDGNLSNLKMVGSGVYEMRLHFGPGYRVYLGKSGDRLVILLNGGTKQRQQNDIEKAKLYWRDFIAYLDQKGG